MTPPGSLQTCILSDHELRMIDVRQFYNVYIPKIDQEFAKHHQRYIPWAEELESAFKWMICECLSKTFQCKITGHGHSDLGQFMMDTFADFEFHFAAAINQFRFSLPRKPRTLQCMVLGYVLVVAITYQ